MIYGCFNQFLSGFLSTALRPNRVQQKRRNENISAREKLMNVTECSANSTASSVNITFTLSNEEFSRGFDS